MRLTQALFNPLVLNLLCYVDDPIAAMRGAGEDRMVYAAMMILVWEAVGFGLSYHKGQMEDSVTWIGATLTADAGGVRAQIKQSITTSAGILNAWQHKTWFQRKNFTL